MTLAFRTAIATAAIALPLFAQSTASITIGADGQGCQTPAGAPATLTAGVPASATFDFAYDRTTALLTLTVTNTSAIVGDDANPVLTEFFLNLPKDAVTGAELVSQTGAGGAAAAFDATCSFDALHANCFGDFDLRISAGGTPHGAIANGLATNVGGPPGAAVVGPVVFVIQLSGPGVSNVNAGSIANGYSSGGARANVRVAAKFVAAGPNAAQSGMLASGSECECGTWATAPARIGTTIQLCQNGQAGCHDCLWISGIAGPTRFGAPFNLTSQVGFPLLAILDYDFGPNNEICTPIAIPNDPQLVGVTLYFDVLTHPNPFGSIADLGFCGAFDFTIVN